METAVVKCLKCDNLSVTTREVGVHMYNGLWVIDPSLWGPEDDVRNVVFYLCDEHARRFDGVNRRR